MALPIPRVDPVTRATLFPSPRSMSYAQMYRCKYDLRNSM